MSDQPARLSPGDTAPDHFFNLRSAVVDNKGNLITLDLGDDKTPPRIAKWSPQKKLLWQRSSSTASESNRK